MLLSRHRFTVLGFVLLILLISTVAVNAGGNYPPLLHLQAPQDFSNQSGTLKIDMAVKDTTTINTVNFNYKAGDGISWTTTGDGISIGTGTLVSGTTTAGTWELSWDTSSLSTGTYGVKAMAVDASGNYTYSPGYTFYIKNQVETTPPSVKYTYPTSGSTAVYASDSVRVVFDRELDPSTVTTSDVILFQGSTQVPGSVTYQAKTILFTPSSNLNYSTAATLQISTGVKSKAGIAMTQPYTLNFTTSSAPASTPPQVGAVLTRPLSSTSIGIRWDVVSGSQAEWYKIYRDSSQTGSFSTLVATVKGSGANYMTGYYVDTNLAASTAYWYRITSGNSLGESSKSTDFSNTYTNQNGVATTEYLNSATTFAPAYPTGVVLTSGDSVVGVNWVPNPEQNLQGYNVYRSLHSGATLNGSTSADTLVKVNSSLVTAGTTSYTDNTVANDTEYFYRLTAVDSQGHEGPMSVEKRAVPKGPAYPNVPHVIFSPADNWCANCHETHTGNGANLTSRKTEKDTCYTCHDGTVSRDNIAKEFTSPSIHPVGTTISCSGCHSPHLDWKNSNNPKMLLVGRNGIPFNTGNDICFSCHGQGTSLTGGDFETPWYSSARITGSAAPADGIECSGCHQSHGSQSSGLTLQKNENLCLSCHDRSAPAGLDEYDKLLNQPDSLTHHDILFVNQQANGSSLTCTNCHNTHSLGKQFKLVDPANPGPARENLWQGISEPTLSNPFTGTINEFCLKCHSVSLPAVSTSDTLTLSSGNHRSVNVQDTYYTTTDTANLDYHGENTSTSQVTTDTLNAMGYTSINSVNYILACTKCHDVKGSLNSYSLVTQVTSVDGSLSQNNLLSYSWTYKSGTMAKVGTDLRFFCTSCHASSFEIDSNHSNLQYPSNCLSCHSHGNKL